MLGLTLLALARFPRSRGDEPQPLLQDAFETLFSPLTRG